MTHNYNPSTLVCKYCGDEAKDVDDGVGSEKCEVDSIEQKIAELRFIDKSEGYATYPGKTTLVRVLPYTEAMQCIDKLIEREAKLVAGVKAIHDYLDFTGEARGAMSLVKDILREINLLEDK